MNLDLASFLFDTKFFIWVGALYCFKFQQNSWGGGDIVFIMEELVNILEFQLDIKKIMETLGAQDLSWSPSGFVNSHSRVRNVLKKKI